MESLADTSGYNFVSEATIIFYAASLFGNTKIASGVNDQQLLQKPIVLSTLLNWGHISFFQCNLLYNRIPPNREDASEVSIGN
jgi:hypothetical protein